MVLVENFASVVEVRSGRRLFVRKVSINASTKPTATPKVQIVAVHGTCATQQQYQALLDAIDDQGILHVDVVLYDCLGLAQSPVDTYDSTAYSNEEHWQDLQAISERFTSENLPTFFMGHSYGPSHIFNYLSAMGSSNGSSANRRNVKGLVLIATALRSEHLTQPDGGHPIFKLPLFVLNCIQGYLTSSFLRLAVHPDNLPTLQTALQSDNQQNDMAVARAYHTNMQWRHDVPSNFAISTLIVHGAQDQLIPVECGQHLHNFLQSSSTSSSSKLVVVETAGHLVQIEQASTVAKEITTFITQQLAAE